MRNWIAAAIVAVTYSASYADASTIEDRLRAAKKAAQAGKYADAAALYRALSDEGSGEAAVMLGAFHWRGAGVPQDHKLSCDYMELAEQRGDVRGTEMLGDCFFHGKGRRQDYARSATQYQKAIKAGFAIAHCALGN